MDKTSQLLELQHHLPKTRKRNEEAKTLEIQSKQEYPEIQQRRKD